MARSLSQVDDALASLETRVNQIDGTNLNEPSASSLAHLQKDINGVITTIRQTTLTLQSTIADLDKVVKALKIRVDAHIGG